MHAANAFMYWQNDDDDGDGNDVMKRGTETPSLFRNLQLDPLYDM